jgi:hypothetical protein
MTNMSQIVVVRVIDEFSVVLNIGSDEGITEGDKFLVYYIAPDEILDPVTGESLGNLEIVRGSGSVIHVQDKMCTIKSNRTETGGRIIRKSGFGGIGSLMGGTVEYPAKQPIPFEYVKIGDIAKQI